MVIFYGLPVVGNMLLWYSNINIRRGPPLRYKAYDTGEGRIGVFPCLPVSGKAVSELYREKIDALQAAESRLLAQRAAAQSAAAEQVRQAEKDGAALVAAAQETARRDAADALRRAEAQADTERAAMLAWRLKTKGVKGKVIVLDANPQPLAKAPGFLAAYNELYKDYLEYQPNMRITGLDYEKKVVRTELGDYPFTLANVIPPMKAAEIVRQAGLGERWANVRIPYFLSEADDRVYLVGDITGNTPYPKSGMIAYVSGTIVARHLTERLKGKPLAEIPPELPTNICYSFVDSEEAIWVSANYSWDEAEKRIKAQSQVDNQRSKANGEAAIGWALGLWNDMFGPA